MLRILLMVEIMRCSLLQPFEQCHPHALHKKFEYCFPIQIVVQNPDPWQPLSDHQSCPVCLGFVFDQILSEYFVSR